MDPMSLLLAALTAGATAAAKDTASQAVKDSYASLKTLILQRFAGKQTAEVALTEYEKDEKTWKKPLQKALTDTGIDQDQTILQQAQFLLKQADPQQASSGKYIIHINQGYGNVIGDGSEVEQNWYKE